MVTSKTASLGLSPKRLLGEWSGGGVQVMEVVHLEQTSLVYWIHLESPAQLCKSTTSGNKGRPISSPRFINGVMGKLLVAVSTVGKGAPAQKKTAWERAGVGLFIVDHHIHQTPVTGAAPRHKQPQQRLFVSYEQE